MLKMVFFIIKDNKTHYENRQLSIVTHYKKGALVGEWVSYLPSGEIECKGKYVNDEKVIYPQ